MNNENSTDNLNIQLSKRDAIDRFIEEKLKKRKIIYYVLLALGINSFVGGLGGIFQFFSIFFVALGAEFSSGLLIDLVLVFLTPGVSLILLTLFYKSKFITRESIEKYINEDLEYHEPKYITFLKIFILSIIAIVLISLLLVTIGFIIKNVLL